MRTIKEFSEKYEQHPTTQIEKLVHKWVVEREIDDFLGTPIAGGVLIGDMLSGDGLTDQVSPEVRAAFEALMGDKANSYDEVRQLFLEKAAISEKSVEGLINKIQGQLGENVFIENMGSAASLASNGAQEGWDVAVTGADGPQYIQVKVYQDADAVIDEIREVNEKVASGVIAGAEGSEQVISIDFAVNSDIFEEVKNKAREEGLTNNILNLGASRDEIRDGITNVAENVIHPLDDFFIEVLGATLTAGALHATINGFLLWKGAKERGQAVEDTFYSSAISGGGLAAAHLAATVLSGSLGFVFIAGVGMGTRSILKRFSQRRFLVQDLAEGNEKLRRACTLARFPPPRCVKSV